VKKSNVSLAILAFLCGTLHIGNALADIAPYPRDVPRGKTALPLVVKYDANKDVSVLRISRQVVKPGAAVEPNKNGDWSPSAPRSIIAAIAMSVGIAGAFFVRGRRRLGLAAVALVAGTFMITSAVQTYGNAAPMPPHKPVPLPAEFQGHVVIEIVDKEFSGVELIIGTKKLPEKPNYPNFGQPLPPKPE
jgi:hypothetical protein